MKDETRTPTHPTNNCAYLQAIAFAKEYQILVRSSFMDFGVITKDGKNPAGDGRSSDRSRISNSSEWN
ncbi:hypothetical protein U9R62_10050 [Cylindrospermopsis raciborskii DSH]|uniref:hypothetical protein n=1 Tax=Cylindrospermopsis raciborskii TaxID=77022 RepID=UPI002EDA3AA8